MGVQSHFFGAANRQYVADFLAFEVVAERLGLAVDFVRGDSGEGRARGPGAFDHALSHLIFGSELDFVGDPGSSASIGVVGPGCG